MKVRSSELEREVKRLTEELEQAKEYEAEMVREVSDTGEAFAKLQSERAKALELQTASDEKIQAVGRQCAAVRILLGVIAHHLFVRDLFGVHVGR
jgi:hypothetical protein